VVNALQALDETKEHNKTIEIITRAREQYAVLIIRDNGPGLPTVDVDRLFDPFFSTRGTGGGEGVGMGLGLAIVKRYTDRYQGIIEAANIDEGGAAFTIKFPMIPDEGKGHDT
jgi:signal transduction histidine kinase